MRGGIRIALEYVALNVLDVFASYISNAYLQLHSSHRDYIICGPEFGFEKVGKNSLISSSLYGGKDYGTEFRHHYTECMPHLYFESCLADPEIWMIPAMKVYGPEYYEYVLLCTDDMLVISESVSMYLGNRL